MFPCAASDSNETWFPPCPCARIFVFVVCILCKNAADFFLVVGPLKGQNSSVNKLKKKALTAYAGTVLTPNTVVLWSGKLLSVRGMLFAFSNVIGAATMSSRRMWSVLRKSVAPECTTGYIYVR